MDSKKVNTELAELTTNLKKNWKALLVGYTVFLISISLIFGLEQAMGYLVLYSFLGLIALLLINTMTSSSGKEDKRFKSGYSEGPEEGILAGQVWMLYPVIFAFANIIVAIIIAIIVS